MHQPDLTDSRVTSLLFIGDIHLGRVPTRLAGAELDPHRLTPAVAWSAAVELALSARVAAVVLAGDVVDDEQDRFEAYDHLERGVRRLVEHGVAVSGVAGNHDSLVLPRLADRIEAFRLLGRAGRWEHHSLATDPPVDLLGWSFPARHHRDDPLEAPGLAAAVARRRPGAALLGVLHADLDAAGSVYAPTTMAGLNQLGLDACLLGHIHQPSELLGAVPIGYLGSLVGLDRGELGQHGAWLVRVAGPARVQVEQVQLGPVRWEQLQVSLEGLPDDDGVPDAIHAAVERSIRARLESEPGLSDPCLQAVGCSATFLGATAAHGRVREALLSFSPAELSFEIGDQRWAVVAWQDRTRLPVDLSALAEQRTPVGQLARLLQGLERGDALGESLAPLIARAIEPYDQGRWRSDGAAWDPEQTHAALSRSAWRLLDVLQRQQARQGGE